MDNTTLIIKYTDKELTTQEEALFKKELDKDPELMYEYHLHLQLNSFMKGKFMSEDIEEDVLFDDVDKLAKETIKEYILDDSQNNLLDYLNQGKVQEAKADFDEKIEQIERESSEKGIDKLTNQWVKDWDEGEKETAYFNQIKTFVANGMNQDDTGGQQKVGLKVIKSNKKDNRLRFINKWSYAVASIAAILIISVGLWTYFDTAVDKSELFASNYQPYKIVSKQLRSFSDEKSKLTEAIDLYKAQKYGQASVLLKGLISSGKQSAEVHLLYALTLVEQEKYEKAISEFNDVVVNFDNYQLEASWYMALCYLKIDNADNAVPLLEELASTKNYYQARALKILDEIK